MSSKISDQDKKVWESFLNSKEKLKDKDNNNKRKNYYLVRSIDLHGFTLEDANKKVEEFIIKSSLERVNKLIVVTGKGIH